MTFPFLDLPPEIRTKIYTHLLTSPCTISLNSRTAHTLFPLPLLQTCLQIYQEVRPLYFSTNIFSLTVHKRNDDWDYMLDEGELWQDRRRLIRELRINVMRWGSKDFFCAVLIPCLEDMVLNGQLRVLEVWVRGVHSMDVERTTVGRNGVLRKQRPVEMLKRLLEDPYLDRVKLWACRQDHWDFDDACSSGNWIYIAEHGQPAVQDITWLLNR